MLPNLGTLALAPRRACTRTGEHYKLKKEEEAELEAQKAVEIYSQDTPKATDNKMFRIAKKKGLNNDLAEDYDWFSAYDPERGPVLWEYARTHRTDPLGKPWWYEDWIDLRSEYASAQERAAPIPAWVEALERLGTEDIYAYDADGRRRLVRVESKAQISWFTGPPGEERLERITYSDGRIAYYEGPKDQERLVKGTFPNGDVQYYEGPPNEARLVRLELPNGDVKFYEGPRGEEHMVRWVFGDDQQQQIYIGPKGQERLVSMTLPKSNGPTTYYEGPKNQERQVRLEYPNGTIRYYEGAYGKEHMVRMEVPEYRVVYYEMENGTPVEKRSVRKKWNNDPFPADGRHTSWSDRQLAYSWGLITGPWLARYVNANGAVPDTATMNQAQVPFEDIRAAILNHWKLKNTLGMIVADDKEDAIDAQRNDAYLKAIRNKLANGRNPEGLQFGLMDWARLLGRDDFRNQLRDIPAPSRSAEGQQPIDALYY